MEIRIGHLSTIGHTALVMQGSDLFKETGLKTTWRLFGGGPAIVESLGKNEIDLGYIGLPPAMIGISKGVRIKCVAGGHIEGTALCTVKNHSTENEVNVINGLRGEKIGSPPQGSIHDIIIRHLLKKHDVEADVVNYPWADFIPLAMERREITAAVGTPALAVFLNNELNAKIALPPSKIWPFNPSYGILAREEFLGKKELEIFLRAHTKACQYIIKNPIEVAKAAMDLLGFVDNNFTLEVLKLSPHFCAALPVEYINSTLAFVPVMKDLGYISQDLSLDEIFYTPIIERIHQEEDHYRAHLKL
jgi:NitT/TauT family transport system substrate-binding protein